MNVLVLLCVPGLALGLPTPQSTQRQPLFLDIILLQLMFWWLYDAQPF